MTDLIPLINAIDAVLPQTQCTKCGYNGCRPYAEAIANDDAINKCPPGGAAVIEQLAHLLQKPVIPLDTTHGEEPDALRVAYIREPECIGCTKCIQVCPVDAILGAAKLMHTVMADICTGCDLCVAACPVDCIDMVPAAEQQPSPETVQQKKDLSRNRFKRRNERLQQLADARAARKQVRIDFHEQTDGSSEQRNAAVLAALAALREKSAQQPLEEQRAKLEKTLASAQERFDRAEAKVREAEAKNSSQLAQLQARREDMRFKLEETRKKLAALDAGALTSSATDAAQAALEKMLAARSRLTDAERLARGRDVLETRIAETRKQLADADQRTAASLQEALDRLLKKREEL